MRFLTAAVLAAALALLSRSARADEASTYQVTYLQVANDCTKDGLSLSRGAVEVKSGAKDSLTVAVPGVPVMKGTRTASGKFKAESRGATDRPGVQGKFSSSGRVSKGSLQMVFIVEFYRGKRPLCTQSWSATGKSK